MCCNFSVFSDMVNTLVVKFVNRTCMSRLGCELVKPKIDEMCKVCAILADIAQLCYSHARGFSDALLP